MHHALHFVGQSYTTSEPNSTSAGVFLVIVLLYLAVIVFLLWASAKIYMKAGRKWWEAIVPIYNIYVLQQIVGRPGWWTVLYFIPFVNIVVSIINAADLAKSFGQGVGTTLMLIFFPFIMYPVMAFNSKYQYQGPVAAGSADSMPPADTPSTQSSTSDTTGPQPPTSTEPAPTAPEVPTSTPPENSIK